MSSGHFARFFVSGELCLSELRFDDKVDYVVHIHDLTTRIGTYRSDIYYLIIIYILFNIYLCLLRRRGRGVVPRH